MPPEPEQSKSGSRRGLPQKPGRIGLLSAAIAAVFLIGAIAAPQPAGANEYKRGQHICDFDYAEKEYKRDSEDIGNQVLYASCLVIKGEDAEGLARLYHLADHQDSVTANFFLAEYWETDGKFANPTTEKNLDSSIKYYLRTQALIALIPTYPEPDYWAYERNEQIEIKSVYSVPVMYLMKYGRGAIGDYCNHALRSGSEKEC